MQSEQECIARAARAFAVGLDLMMSTDPREAAEAAYYAGGPSMEDLEARIVARQSRMRRRSAGAA